MSVQDSSKNFSSISNPGDKPNANDDKNSKYRKGYERTVQNYSSLSNKRDDHDTLTSPKVTLITLLLASITHTRVACRAHKFFKFKDQSSKLSLK